MTWHGSAGAASFSSGDGDLRSMSLSICPRKKKGFTFTGWPAAGKVDATELCRATTTHPSVTSGCVSAYAATPSPRLSSASSLDLVW
jgi:hypothetical protein